MGHWPRLPSAKPPLLIIGRLFQTPPRGEQITTFVRFAMIGLSLLTFMLTAGQLPSWRYIGTNAVLLLMLVLAFVHPWLHQRYGKTRATWIAAIINGGLLLVAIGMAGNSSISSLTYLLFLLVGQTSADSADKRVLWYALALFASILGLLWLGGVSMATLWYNASWLALGMVFAIGLGFIIVWYSTQTERAEFLLAELQQANAELTFAREREKGLAIAEERLRLARDIHDGLGHHLTVLNIQLQVAAKMLSHNDSARAAEAVDVCRQEAQATLEEVRRSLATMRTSPLDQRPLDQAIMKLVDEFNQHSAAVASYTTSGDTSTLPSSLVMTLYRTAQEGLTNVRKHAAAQTVTIDVKITATHAQMKLINDTSSRPLSAVPSNGFGLVGLRERAELVGGTFTAGPMANGFCIEVSLPL